MVSMLSPVVSAFHGFGSPGRLGRRILIAVAVVGASIGGGLFASSTAGATPTLTLTPTTNVFVTPNSTVLLNGLSVSGDTTDQLQVTVATTLGTLSISTTTGLTLGYNNSWTGSSSVTFNGLQSAVDTGLASVSLVSGSTTGTATIGLTAMVAQSGYNYLASNQHFYEYVACGACSWTAADSGAQALSFEGQQGYLATIPNATVNTFISTKIANATNVWFGARAYESIATDGTQAYATVNSTTYARVWRWAEGAGESPIAGGVISECTNQTGSCTFANSGSFYTSWNSGEPNNSGGSATVAYQGEYVAVTNWSGTLGSWNDLSPTNDANVNGYVVEFGGKTNSNSALGTGFAGVVTTSSNVVVAAAATAPLPPTITGTAANASVNLSWTPPGDGGSAITGYQVSTDGGSTWNAITTTTTTNIVNGNVVTTVSATPVGLTNGTAYSIEVEAINNVGHSVGSNVIVLTPITVPGAPTSVTASSQNGSASVSWSAPVNNGGAPITGYTVTASPGGATATCSLSPCAVNGLSNGTAYTFTVVATNSAGNGTASLASGPITPATVPGAPTSVTATSQNGSASVSWIPPVGNGGGAITGYTVTASPGGASAPCATSPCVVTGLSNGTPYTFTVVATNSAGNGAASSPSSAITPVTGPGAPTGVTANSQSGSASVSWTAPVNNGGGTITGYTVTASPGGATATCATSPCVVNGLSNGTSYSFTVVATNGAGNSVASSPSGSITPATVPGAPTNVSATSQNGSASVSWTAPANNGGGTITGYTVTASPGGATATCATSPCVVNGLSNGTAYTFTVVATNTVGDSVASLPSGSIAPATVPGAPTNVSATLGNGSASVSWTPPVGNGGASITGYTVTALPGGVSVSCSSSPCVVNGLNNGTSYTFTVVATNGTGNSVASSPSGSITPATVSDAPTNVSATLGNGSASVSWTAPVNNGGATVSGYTVTASPGGVTATCATSPCVVNGLSNGTAYTFSVIATNSAGNSGRSLPSGSITPATVPGAPTNVSAALGNRSASVSWSAPVDNGGSTISGYTVTASPGGVTVSCSSSPCVVNGLNNGTAYTFTVVAINSAGNSVGSSQSGSVTPATLPDSPTSVAASSQNGSTSVSWTAPVDSGGVAISGYTVTASPGGATATCATSPCVVNGLSNGTSYTFTVVAINSTGDSAPSPPSGSITPAAAPDAPTNISATSGDSSASVSWIAPLNNGGATL
jgi:invasion protein IalB